MDFDATFQISASGMAVEKLRFDVAAANIANMHSTAPSAAGLFRPLSVLSGETPLSFADRAGALHGAGGAHVVDVVPTTAPPRLVYEPGHPYADGKGFVAYPGVDHTAEMLNLTTALRAYEANVAAMAAARSMATRTLEIGGQS